MSYNFSNFMIEIQRFPADKTIIKFENESKSEKLIEMWADIDYLVKK